MRHWLCIEARHYRRKCDTWYRSRGVGRGSPCRYYRPQCDTRYILRPGTTDGNPIRTKYRSTEMKSGCPVSDADATDGNGYTSYRSSGIRYRTGFPVPMLIRHPVSKLGITDGNAISCIRARYYRRQRDTRYRSSGVDEGSPSRYYRRQFDTLFWSPMSDATDGNAIHGLVVG